MKNCKIRYGGDGGTPLNMLALCRVCFKWVDFMVHGLYPSEVINKTVSSKNTPGDSVSPAMDLFKPHVSHIGVSSSSLLLCSSLLSGMLRRCREGESIVYREYLMILSPVILRKSGAVLCHRPVLLLRGRSWNKVGVDPSSSLIVLFVHLRLSHHWSMGLNFFWPQWPQGCSEKCTPVLWPGWLAKACVCSRGAPWLASLSHVARLLRMLSLSAGLSSGPHRLHFLSSWLPSTSLVWSYWRPCSNAGSYHETALLEKNRKIWTSIKENSLLLSKIFGSAQSKALLISLNEDNQSCLIVWRWWLLPFCCCFPSFYPLPS